MPNCLICDRKFLNYKGLTTHIRYHNLTKEEYYLAYIFKDGDNICRNCNNITRFISLEKGYAKYCSLKCSNSSNEVKKKKEKSYLKNFGVSNPLKSEKIRGKIISTSLIKYGTDNPSKCKVIKDRVKQSNLFKFGVDYPMMNQSIKNKSLYHKRNNWFIALFNSDRLKDKVIPNFTLDDYVGTHYKYSWICTKCGNIFEDHLDNGRIPRCLKCYPYEHSNSNLEKEVSKFIKFLEIDIIENDRSVLKGQELDIYIPSHNLAIEFDGLYWHSELQGIDKNYHLNKTLMCQEKGIQLLHIFEDEWIDKQEIVKSIIKAKLGKIENKIFARKCQVQEVPNDEAKLFLFDNHLQGPINGNHLGLYYNDELVSLLSYGKPRFNKNYNWEILRFCNKINTSIVGGLSKLLKYANLNSVITYCDLRFGVGGGYKQCGFIQVDYSEPSFYYIKNNQKYNRLQFQKHLLEDKLDIFDPTLTGWQNMQLNGYDRIWDCGCILYEV